jgi:hypothetical protein
VIKDFAVFITVELAALIIVERINGGVKGTAE